MTAHQSRTGLSPHASGDAPGATSCAARHRDGEADVPHAWDIAAVRRHFLFPTAGRIVTNNAASTQPPRELLALYHTSAAHYENVHRGQSDASQRTTRLFEAAYDASPRSCMRVAAVKSWSTTRTSCPGMPCAARFRRSSAAGSRTGSLGSMHAPESSIDGASSYRAITWTAGVPPTVSSWRRHDRRR